jgi:heat shock protein HtpX
MADENTKINLRFNKLKDEDVNKMGSDTLGTTPISPWRLYKGRNLFSAVSHYGASAGLASAAFMIASPWAVAAAVVLVGGINYLAIKAQKRFLENNLEVQPDTSAISPRLGEIADELYAKSGLKAEGNPIYDFKPDADKVKKSGSIWTELLAKMQDMAAKTHNAAALQMGKPVIMISKPLLKLLDDNEEKAVLAHEFAHAAARHQYLTMPASITNGIASSAVALTLFGALFTLGWTPVILSTLAGVAAAVVYKKALSHKNQEIMSKEDKELSFPDIAKKKKLKGMQKVVSAVVDTSVIYKYNPAYVLLYAASKATSTAAKLINKAFSRSIEYQADRGAVTYGADPLALATGLRKIETVMGRSIKAAYGNEPVPKKGFLKKTWANLTADHPSTENRVKRLCKMAKKQGVAQEFIDKAARGTIEVSADNDLPPSLLKSLACGGDALHFH